YALTPSSGKDGKYSGHESLGNITARKNLAETAFFFPSLMTDENGNVIIKFTIPEALTKWKMLGFAHTKDLKFGQIEKEVVTQKELMVTPHAPRFFRENDKITFTAKVDNLSSADMNGTAQLFLYDAITMKDITAQLSAGGEQKTFTAKKGGSAPLEWDLTIPEGIGAITYKVVAKAGNFSDGEESAVPVLTNRMLVTESLPLPIRSKQTKTFKFEKFISQNNNSSTLRNHKLTLEFSANPAWYAVQSLPYIMEYPYECAEQTFSRFYANSIASHIANSSPKIKAVFDNWKEKSPEAFLSNLQKNQELKSLMLEETPWVLDAKDESERKKRVGLLFDLNKMSNELEAALNKLQKMQASNGGWPWFDGMPDDRYITQHIITGMGHLDHLGVKKIRDDSKTWYMVKNGVRYLDDRIREDYEWILKHDKENIDKDHLSYEQIQYLYARSYFKDISISSRDQKAFDYYKGQAQKYWLGKGRYMGGMIALGLFRYGDKTIPADIMKSLKENSLNSEEMGMYWKENYEGFYWYEAPIECQSLLIEAFDEVSGDKKAVDDLKVWLLKSKQTQNWESTKATTEAVYALLLRGTDWLATESNIEISLGDMKVDPKNIPDVKVEAGTGYFKTSWSGSDIKPQMGNITVSKKDEGVSWGAVYWQYFEQLDKITPHKTPLQLVKKLFIEKNTASGPVIEPLTENTKLKPGDKLKVRIELRVDRDMEYVHMKDMRASGFEPTNVFSQYKYQDGLGYYESTRDAATNFFFSRLPKGTYVFEYPLVVSHSGDFSNGITSIQCMYAPEFTSHSEGVRVKVGK
ncbi:MAG TPA: alpha-2-macroglobulin family protein, partial [Bacteroidia bacterium]